MAAAAVGWGALAPGAAMLRARLGLTQAQTQAEAAAPGAGPRGQVAGPATVIGGVVTQGRANVRVSAIGDARALRSVTVKPLSSGRLVSLDKAAGDAVRAGEVVARLDDDLERIALERAELVVEDAAATHERVRRLLARGAATDVQEREARLALERARLEARDAALALERRKILAPIDGLLGLPPVEAGAQVDTGTPIATIEDRTSLLVEFRAPDRVVGRIKVGDPVAAAPLARPELSLEGEVSALDNRLDPASRTLLVQAALPNADDRLRPGMAFVVEMRLPGEPFPEIDALAIQWGADGPFVWAERAGKAAKVPVRIVQRSADKALVAGDLALGERVVSEGAQRLRPGTPLRFLGDPPPEAGGAPGRGADAAAGDSVGGPTPGPAATGAGGQEGGQEGAPTGEAAGGPTGALTGAARDAPAVAGSPARARVSAREPAGWTAPAAPQPGRDG